ncbi:ATP-binding protein [Myxococcus xanthus]|uniref:ATP-binding protein n=1 Tax=Myxococcus xanthus TaxID=34 RepID=A0A7Y4IF24_MYXXA|nr:ATP-binding protein [Myxococcus xanthus]NOJ78061.1 ATP-binding protein [Myxococcus xanthus]NOJ84492.1 ATP-binding protein [Myxococcus xanthus]
MTTPSLPLRTTVLAALALTQEGAGDGEAIELRFLRQHLDATGRDWVARARERRTRPGSEDAGLVMLGEALGLSLVELLAVALVAAVEEDPMVGRAVAYLQTPVGASRPTLGLVSSALAPAASGDQEALRLLTAGAALGSGLLTRLREDLPLCEQTLAMPLPLLLALSEHDVTWPGATLGSAHLMDVPLPPSLMDGVHRHARFLAGSPRSTLVLRGTSVSETRTVAAAVAMTLGRAPLFLGAELQRGLGPFLIQRGLLPIHVHDLAPGERKVIPNVPYYDGPVLAITGPEGTLDAADRAVLRWSVPRPPSEERRALWESSLGAPDLAEELARRHRQGAGRIAQLGRLARQKAELDGRQAPELQDVLAAAWEAESEGMSTLAEPLMDAIHDDAIVLVPQVKRELELLLARCRARDDLVHGLGPSATVRYRAGVRALFMGASGTGKTLAAGWLATKLGLPLYRVDLASVTSKYIGETEKNLSQLFARAEHADLVLLFDEADSLFAKRTDVKDSNDRFANAQTNYLLQRIEAFDGVAILTSNSKSRFDSAFTRRLDAIIDFTLPGPSERRALWTTHLGMAHELPAKELNRLAATADLAGGQIRNVVLTAALIAREAGRAIQPPDIIEALVHEYRKQGREPPSELRTTPLGSADGARDPWRR